MSLDALRNLTILRSLLTNSLRSILLLALLFVMGSFSVASTYGFLDTFGSLSALEDSHCAAAGIGLLAFSADGSENGKEDPECNDDANVAP